ncbi:MAG TPA: FKBP-type peptidyl-prolyl cis-trans isomerase [Planctomycetota bacterium]|nr:FKBP-type peptidyl-prolyl cis-trans isomerase [Planctomycetota bacterium]
MPDEKPAEPTPPPPKDPGSGLAVAIVVLLVGAMAAGAWLLHREHVTVGGIEKTALTDLGPDAVTTPSGLRYKEFQVGAGPSPKVGQIVVVHYHGRFPDGTVFDSSRQKGAPYKFPIGMGKVIKGWDEGILDMKVGGIRRFVVPPELAYGAQGSAPRIPPNATLVFDVELKAIE